MKYLLDVLRAKWHARSLDRELRLFQFKVCAHTSGHDAQKLQEMIDSLTSFDVFMIRRALKDGEPDIPRTVLRQLKWP